MQACGGSSAQGRGSRWKAPRGHHWPRYPQICLQSRPNMRPNIGPTQFDMYPICCLMQHMAGISFLELIGILFIFFEFPRPCMAFHLYYLRLLIPACAHQRWICLSNAAWRCVIANVLQPVLFALILSPSLRLSNLQQAALLSTLCPWWGGDAAFDRHYSWHFVSS